MIENLTLAGHDSELFSFLNPAYVAQLQQHPAADVPLWTFGSARNEQLDSVSMWNTSPGCWAWRKIPPARRDGDWWHYRGLTTHSDLVQVAALVLVRHLFVQGYTCALDDQAWIHRAADRRLERLRYIRGWGGCSVASPEWMGMQAEYFDWAITALDALEEGRRG